VPPQFGRRRVAILPYFHLYQALPRPRGLQQPRKAIAPSFKEAADLHGGSSPVVDDDLDSRDCLSACWFSTELKFYSSLRRRSFELSARKPHVLSAHRDPAKMDTPEQAVAGPGGAMEGRSRPSR